MTSNPETVVRDMRYLHPELADRASKAIAALQIEIHGISVFETWRSPDRQTFLFAKGRSEPGPKVTKAKAWQSWHQFGCAVDLAVFHPGDPAKGLEAHWSWDFDRDKVREMMVTVHKLEPGPSFETAHFQLTLAMTIDEANYIARQDGILAVWQRIDYLLKK